MLRQATKKKARWTKVFSFYPGGSSPREAGGGHAEVLSEGGDGSEGDGGGDVGDGAEGDGDGEEPPVTEATVAESRVVMRVAMRWRDDGPKESHASLEPRSMLAAGRGSTLARQHWGRWSTQSGGVNSFGRVSS